MNVPVTRSFLKKGLSMSFGLRFLLALLAYGMLTFSQPPESADAQPIPTWRNDAQGRPAPPCMTLDTTTGLSTPCPAPAGGTGTAAGATTIIEGGGASTAFGNQWFNNVIISTPTVGLGCVYVSDLLLNCAGQQAGSATNLRIYQSTDGGKTLPLTFTTSNTPGGLSETGQMVRSATGQYWLAVAQGGVTGNNPHVSADLNTWVESSGISSPGAATINGNRRIAVGGPAGNTIVTMTESGGIRPIRVCRTLAPSLTFACTNPATFDNTQSGIGSNSMQYVTGSTWIMIDAVGHLFRSINDAATWTAITTLAGTQAASQNNVTCISATVCLAQRGNTIHRSTDAGLTWTQVIQFTGAELLGVLNYGSGNVVFMGNFLSTATPQPGCGPTCQNLTGSFRTLDGGVSWVSAFTPWLATAGAGRPYETLLARTNGSAVAIIGVANNGPMDNTRNYGYTTAIPGGVSVLSRGEIPIVPVQAGLLLNTQTTGAAATPVVVTLTGVGGFRVHLYGIEARCGTAADTANVTVAEGATTRWTTGAAQVIFGTNFVKTWVPGLTFNDGASAVVTLSACTAGTGTLIIQADQF